jgi:hypothetical protein
MTELHIAADGPTTWHVYDGDEPSALSEHSSATEAELAAQAWAEERDADRIVIHDCYHRTHDVAPAPAGRRARAMRARARRLGLVRERLAKAGHRPGS